MVKVLVLYGQDSPEGVLKEIEDKLAPLLGGGRPQWEYDRLQDITRYRLALNNTKKIVLIEWLPGAMLDQIIALSPKAQVYLFTRGYTLSESDSRALARACSQFRWIQGVLDLSRPCEWSLPLLVQAFEKRELQGRTKDLAEMGKGLNQLVGMGLFELQRIKKLHERVVSLRKEQYKGIQLVSKYAAGESPGGEFFDVIPHDNSLTLLLSSCSSYLASGLILTHFERWREEKGMEMPQAQKALIGLKEELEKAGKHDGLEILLVRIDLRSLEVEGLNFGRAQLISEKAHYINGNTFPVSQVFMAQAHFGLKLARGEKLAVVSPGVAKNTSGDFIGKRTFKAFFAEFLPKGATALLNELFFELKRGRRSDFLEHDASAIIIEVDPNAIIQM